MPSSITRYLDLLDEQREAIFHELGPLPDAVLWYRPGPRVWSIGEHLDHTRVLNCGARRLMMVDFRWRRSSHAYFAIGRTRPKSTTSTSAPASR